MTQSIHIVASGELVIDTPRIRFGNATITQEEVVSLARYIDLEKRYQDLLIRLERVETATRPLREESALRIQRWWRYNHYLKVAKKIGNSW